VSKFEDDPTVNESGIIILLGFGCIQKKRMFWKKKKGEFGRKEEHRDVCIVTVKTWSNMSLFIVN